MIVNISIHFCREAFLAQQEQRKAAKAAKSKKVEPPKEPEKVQLKKKTEVKKPEPAPEEPKEVPKLKHVEKIKESSPVRRSQSPELDRDRLKRVDSPKRAESPARCQSPIPKLKPVPKKATEKESTPVKVRPCQLETNSITIGKDSVYTATSILDYNMCKKLSEIKQLHIYLGLLLKQQNFKHLYILCTFSTYSTGLYMILYFIVQNFYTILVD